MTLTSRIHDLTAAVAAAVNARAGRVGASAYDLAVLNGYSGTQAQYLAQWAPLLSPAFSGVPTAPTPAAGDSSTQIATTAFSAQGTNLTDGSVYGQKLTLTDYYNLFENPRFDTEVASGWGQAIRGMWTHPNARIDTPGALNALAIRGAGGAVNTDTFTAGVVPVIPGDQLWAQWDAATLATAGGGLMRVQVRWFTTAKATMSWSALRTDVAQTSMPLSSGAFTTYSGTVTAPANAAYAQLALSYIGGSTSTTSSVIYLRNILFKRVATAALVPNASTGTISFGSGFSATSGRLNSVRLGPDGDVTLNLSVTKSGTLATGETVATLPVGYRPGATVDVVAVNGTQLASLQILTSGAVTLAQGGGVGTTLAGSVRFPQVN